MTKDTIIQLPLINQLTDTKNNDWKDQSCGICSLQMLISFKQPKIADIPVMELLERCLVLSGYVKDVGWKHVSLVELAKEYDVSAEYQKLFYGRDKTKEEGLKFINKKIKSGQPIMASIYYGFNPAKGGHLVIVNGYRREGKNIIGYHIQDPYPGKRGNNYFVSRDEFLAGWRGGLIWLEE